VPWHIEPDKAATRLNVAPTVGDTLAEGSVGVMMMGDRMQLAGEIPLVELCPSTHNADTELAPSAAGERLHVVDRELLGHRP
jgi:hypothetical protein